MDRLPTGYNAICKGCGEPFTFKNARAVGSLSWPRYCTNTCMENWKTQKRIAKRREEYEARDRSKKQKRHVQTNS